MSQRGAGGLLSGYVGFAPTRIALIVIAVVLMASAVQTDVAQADEGGPGHSCADHDVQQLDGTHDGDGDGIGCENLPASRATRFPTTYVGLGTALVLTVLLVFALWRRHRRSQANRLVRAATRRQLDYLSDLIAQYPDGAREVGITAHSIEGLSRPRASELIEKMQPYRRANRARVRPASDGAERLRRQMVRPGCKR